MKKKTKISLIILSVILVFCLWYTRPRSFEELAGDGSITSVGIIGQTSRVENGKPYIDTWIVNSEENGSHVISGIEDILKSCKYRVSLRSLLPFSSAYNISGKGDVLIQIVAVMEDGSTFLGSYKGQSLYWSLTEQW